MNPKPIYVSQADHARLSKLIEELAASGAKSRGMEGLRTELQRANVVDTAAISADLVTLNSLVSIRDEDTGELETYTVTLPEDADPEESKISILSPIGTGLLGYSVGDWVEWETPGGLRHLRIESVEHPKPQRKKQELPRLISDILGNPVAS